MSPPDAEADVPAATRTRYRVDSAGLQLSTPADWSTRIGADGRVALFMPPHAPDAPFESNLTVVTNVREIGEEPEADLVTEQALALAALDDALLLDSEPTLVGGRPAARALVAYDNDEYELTLEQWVLATADTIILISATAPTFDYAYDADLYGDIVASVVFDD